MGNNWKAWFDIKKQFVVCNNLKTPINACCDLILVSNHSTSKYGRTRNKRFSSTVGTFF